MCTEDRIIWIPNMYMIVKEHINMYYTKQKKRKKCYDLEENSKSDDGKLLSEHIAVIEF